MRNVAIAAAKNSEDLFQEETLTFINENKDQPFFLYYATQLPHGPCITPSIEKFKDKPWDLKHKEWAAMVEHMDRGVGRMVDLLEERKLLENTMIIFAGDNGYSQWYINPGESNAQIAVKRKKAAAMKRLQRERIK